MILRLEGKGERRIKISNLVLNVNIIWKFELSGIV